MVEPSQSTSNMHSSESETQGPGGGNSRDGHVPGRGVPIGSNSDGKKNSQITAYNMVVALTLIALRCLYSKNR